MAVTTAGVLGSFIAATAGGAVLGMLGHKGERAANEEALRQEQAFADMQADFEMPSFEFSMPEAPPLPEPPERPAPAPQTRDASARLEGESRAARARRRTLSLFSTSRQQEGRASTILTSSVGAPGTPPVRRRQLGGLSVLGA